MMNVQPHPFFERRGDDLYTVVPVTVTEASLGAKVEVPTIDGRVAGAHSAGHQQREEAAPARKRRASMRQSGKRGDQYIEVQVVVPKPEDERVRNLLKELRSSSRKIRGRRFLRARRSEARPGEENGRRPRKKAKAGYMISAVAELYKLHPQTLRLYERVGLLKPSRSQGNTRLYTDADLERLEVILNLTRELGVNLAGIEIILNMRDKMGEMQAQMEAFTKFVRNEVARNLGIPDERRSRNAIVRTAPRHAIRVER